jgi:glucokinase
VVESAAASKEIINKCLEEKPSVIFENVFRLFMKIYEAAIGNYLAQHMCIGGLVLVGSLTNGILPKISKMKLLEEWKKRHVEFASNIEDLPLVVCREVDLGLKGAFVVARRIIADNQHE